MGWLGCGPGPEVGRALRFLTLQVLEDPARNRPETLRELLRGWSA
jgi:tRNA nucleotidyltransferase (CCA-adding enzyme)